MEKTVVLRNAGQFAYVIKTQLTTFVTIGPKDLITCNNNNMCNPQLLCMHNFHMVFKIISCIQCGHIITMHHSGYYNLVYLLFGTTIPTSFNILMNYHRVGRLYM